MFGIDVSRWNQGMDFTRADFDFAIVKATEGNGYADSLFLQHTDQLLKMGKLMGAYHFARPDLNKSEEGMRAEARYFYKNLEASGLLGMILPVLDWEPSRRDLDNLIEYWLDEFHSISNIRPIVYASESLFNSTLSWVPLKFEVWMAKWIESADIEPSKAKQNSPNYSYSGYIPWTIWQFTSKGAWPGFTGCVDFNYTNVSREHWQKMCNPIINDEVVKTPDEVITKEMRWAINYNLFSPLKDGFYYPDMEVTREQLADALHRYTTMLYNSLKTLL